MSESSEKGEVTEKREEDEEEEEQDCTKTTDFIKRTRALMTTELQKKDERLCAVLTIIQIFGTETAANVALMERAAEQRTDESLLSCLQTKAAAHFHCFHSYNSANSFCIDLG